MPDQPSLNIYTQAVSRGVLLAMGLALPALAWGHGPAAFGLGVAHSDDDGPRLVALTKGMAWRFENEWRFLCQSQWGGTPSPLAYSADNAHIAWVAGSNDLYTFDGGGHIKAMQRPDLASPVMRRIVANANDAYAFVQREQGVEIWRLVEPTPVMIWSDPATWSSIDVDENRIAVAGAFDSELTILELGFDGSGQARAVVQTLATPATPYVTLANGQIYVVQLRSTGPSNDDPPYTLGRVEAGALVEITASFVPVFGPVADGEDILIIEVGRLTRINGDVPETLPTSDPISCLGTARGRPFVCVNRDLNWASASASIGEVFFDFETVQPPIMDLIPYEMQEACLLDWVDFAVDAGLDWTQMPEGYDAGIEAVDAGGAANGETDASADAGPLAPEPPPNGADSGVSGPVADKPEPAVENDSGGLGNAGGGGRARGERGGDGGCGCGAAGAPGSAVPWFAGLLGWGWRRRRDRFVANV